MIIPLLTSPYCKYLCSSIKPYGSEIVRPSLLCWGRPVFISECWCDSRPVRSFGITVLGSIPTSESATIIGAVAKRIQVPRLKLPRSGLQG